MIQPSLELHALAPGDDDSPNLSYTELEIRLHNAETKMVLATDQAMIAMEECSLLRRELCDVLDDLAEARALQEQHKETEKRLRVEEIVARDYAIELEELKDELAAMQSQMRIAVMAKLHATVEADALEVEIKELRGLLQHNEADIEQPLGLCIVCLEQQVQLLFIECGHVPICQSCFTPTLKGCPMCRSSSTEVRRVYLS